MQNIPPIEELIAAAKWRTNPTDPVNLRRSRGTEELADFACSILLKVPTQDDLHDVIEVLERAMYSEPIGESLRGELVGCVNVLKQICHAVDGFPNLAAMREQMEEIADENRKLKTEMDADLKASVKP